MQVAAEWNRGGGDGAGRNRVEPKVEQGGGGRSRVEQDGREGRGRGEQGGAGRTRAGSVGGGRSGWGWRAEARGAGRNRGGWVGEGGDALSVHILHARLARDGVVHRSGWQSRLRRDTRPQWPNTTTLPSCCLHTNSLTRGLRAPPPYSAVACRAGAGRVGSESATTRTLHARCCVSVASRVANPSGVGEGGVVPRCMVEEEWHCHARPGSAPHNPSKFNGDARRLPHPGTCNPFQPTSRAGGGADKERRGGGRQGRTWSGFLEKGHTPISETITRTQSRMMEVTSGSPAGTCPPERHTSHAKV